MATRDSPPLVSEVSPRLLILPFIEMAHTTNVQCTMTLNNPIYDVLYQFELYIWFIVRQKVLWDRSKAARWPAATIATSLMKLSTQSNFSLKIWNGPQTISLKKNLKLTTQSFTSSVKLIHHLSTCKLELKLETNLDIVTTYRHLVLHHFTVMRMCSKQMARNITMCSSRVSIRYTINTNLYKGRGSVLNLFSYWYLFQGASYL